MAFVRRKRQITAGPLGSYLAKTRKRSAEQTAQNDYRSFVQRQSTRENINIRL